MSRPTFIRLASRLTGSGFVQRMIDLLRQWPWIYPRGIVPSTREWIKHAQQSVGWYGGLRGHWCESIHPEGVSVHDHPAGIPDAVRTYFDPVASRRYPEATVCFFSGAHLAGNEGLVLTPDNRVLAEYYHQFDTQSLQAVLRAQPFGLVNARVRRIDAPTALLAAPQGWNYYHWLFDVLPRLHLLERWRGVITQFAVPENISDVQLEMLRVLGVDQARLLRLSKKQRLRCQHLYVPSLPGSEGCSPPWVLPYLREKFLPAAAGVAGRGERLYITRGPMAARPVLNEAELVARLAQRGFCAIAPEKLSLVEQIALFRDARIIVAAHGAGLANLAFATHTAVLELFSADYARADCYFTLCRQAGFPYDCWLDTRRTSEPKPWGAITVDLDAVDQKLDRLLAGPETTT